MKIQKSEFKNQNLKSFTLIEVLIGTALVLIIFLGIFGAYQLGLKVVGQSKNKITATAIASGEIEKIRNLPYDQVGTIGANLPDAIGILDSPTTTIRNSIEYTTNIWVDYISDEADGSGPADLCNLDYKRVEVEVSWLGRFGGKVKLTTYFAPKNKTEEINSCEAQPAGLLSVSVFNAYGEMLGSPLIEIFNPSTGALVASYSPPIGKHDFPLATSTYKVVVSKSNYSTERTYGTDEITTPEKPHPIVLQGQITEISFSIDKVSTFSIATLSPWTEDYFSDSFLDGNKISTSSNVIISNDEVNLATTSEGYLPSGYLISIDISPESLMSWDEFSFSDSEPENTDLKYQIYYASGTDWILIPDSDLPGNSLGFDSSLVDLSNLATTTYFQLKLKANFSTNSISSTPTLYNWQVSWITGQATPIPHVTFNLRGAKIIGLDSNENPVYKYSATSTSNSNGHIDIPNLEWDNYTFSINPASGLDLVGTDPSPQPIGLSPDTNLTVKLYLTAENSLLVTVQNIETLEPVFSAAVRLFNSDLGYDTTQYTNEKGQTYFIPLEVTTYSLEVQAAGYSTTSPTVFVSGDTTKIIKLEQVE